MTTTLASDTTTRLLGTPGRMNDVHRALYRFRRSPMSILGAIMVGIILVLALVGPYIVPYPNDTTGSVDMDVRLQKPGAAHLFGTDDVGRDIFSRVIAGTRLSVEIGIAVLLVAVFIGVPLGAVAAYFGGVVDEIIMRLTDIFLTVPALVLAMAIAAALGPGIFNAMLAISLVWWPGYCRLTRGQVLALKEQDYVEAARAMGGGPWWIIFRHMLPNTLSPILIKISMDVGFVILVAAGLGYIGVGAQPPAPEWGAMISDGRNYLPDWWWVSTFPGAAIFITVFGFNLLGDGLRDLFDPRTRQ